MKTQVRNIKFNNEMAYQRLRLLMYIAVVVLLNIAAVYMLMHFDLSKTKDYTLSQVSKDTVSQLEEPLTIRAYFSSNLPSNYNTLSSSVRDLMQAYSANAARGMFNYQIFTLNSEDQSAKAKALRDEAESYGIFPVQLQGTDGNEFKAISAYTGLVLIQGEKQESITPLVPNSNIQYQITASLQKMTRRSSALLSLPENLKVYYYYSPLLAQMDNGAYAKFPDNFKSMMAELKNEFYDRIDFSVYDPTKLPGDLPDPQELVLPEISVNIQENGTTKKELVYSAIITDNGGKYNAVSLIQSRPTLQLSSQGLVQGEAIDVLDPAQLKLDISDFLVSSIGFSQTIGYISDRDAATVQQQQQQQQKVTLNTLQQKIQDLYGFQPVQLKDGIPQSLDVLMLVDPEERLSDWDLYQLDQFVMRGGRLIVAIQPYRIVGNPYGGENYLPNPNIVGSQQDKPDEYKYTLKDLLDWYGIDYQNNMVFDKNSFIQRGQNPQTGGYQEEAINYIPEIQSKWGTTKDFPFINNLKIFYMMLSAELKIKKDSGAQSLVMSSPDAWVERMDEGNKSVTNITPNGDFAQRTLIAVSSTKLSSFFADKELPKKPQDEEQDKDGQPQSLASIQGSFVKEGNGHGRVLVSGTSIIFDGQLLGSNIPGNQNLPLNLIDFMANNIDMANLRAKGANYSPMNPKVTAQTKNFIKWFNVLGLPLAVGLLGLMMLLSWRSRQMKLASLFNAAPQGIPSAKNEENQ